MKVGIIGSGGREHALCLSIKKSPKVDRIYCFPGNAGTSDIAENIEIDFLDFNKIKEFSIKNKISLLIVGPEKPLVDGIVDFFKDTEINIFGPDKISSQLEGSKIFTKKICEKYNIPTAKFGIFKNTNDAISFLDKTQFPLVVKADGLASGKGVYICENKDDANLAIKDVFDGKFGLANNILIEEFLVGEEMSYFIISDGKEIKGFETAQDHKRVLEGDKGANTGGMGSYSPSRLLDQPLEEKILNKIIKPTVKALKEMGSNYKGFLYAGLMIVRNEPYLIEYNVRMGDPECQTILPKLKTDLFEIIDACCNKNLKNINIEWHDKKSLCIVLCSKGYPDKYNNEILIENIENLKLGEDDYFFHAGTKKINNKIYSNGGRVINFVSLSPNFKNSRDKAISLIKNLNWKDGFYRKDIGHKVIDE
ncbi:phosphoribosylamine--glycine ligase [Candidatus Pelagibacter giovannonii]|uniref:Phosphoribosylamine--glycine ligase n=1 Tax=Candidatus Pelagibacter giovannonii TaxID=2563896 RepID=A0A6H1Q338_9PROT|nr:phosphoribosylamine--glycine ligase [Candidatus Pelagibacter giovannonii]QIZ21244.1 phosphoribosylamine--glycine ligase [Candidatus Pelagibacter giovannonii]